MCLKILKNMDSKSDTYIVYNFIIYIIKIITYFIVVDCTLQFVPLILQLFGFIVQY